MRYIGIVGSRDRDSFKDEEEVREVFFEVYKDGDRIVSGGCPEGADRFAEKIAKRSSIPILIFYPNWKKYGKPAGFIRNTYIAGEADVLIACVSKKWSVGTHDTIQKYMKKKHPNPMLIMV